MGYTWLGMQKLTWEEVLQRHEKGELAGCFRLYDDNSTGGRGRIGTRMYG